LIKTGATRKGCSQSVAEEEATPCSENMKRNLYKVLGISQDADPAKIKKAYWRAAKRYHPDLSPGTSKKFREVQEAYDTLSNPQKRSIYDTENVKTPPVCTPYIEPTLFSPSPFGFFDLFFSDFQAPLFGHFAETLEDRKREPGSLAAEIILTPEEAEQGSMISVPVAYEILCERCQGSGRYFEFFCNHCQGWGKIRKNVEVRLQIPPGVRNGLVERILLWNSGYQEISLSLTFRVNRN
jgi:molecular chaperone DnaJ